MDRAMWATNTAERLARNPTLRGNWSRQTLELWLRYECRCVYCGRDMLENRDITYYFWCAEHVLPVHKYGYLKDAIWNQVLACRTCNQLKQRFDPASDGTPTDEAHMTILVENAKAHIESRRAEVQLNFNLEAKLLRDALEDFGRSALSASP
jgi:hypothetical protein